MPSPTAEAFAHGVLDAFSRSREACATFLLTHASARFASSVGDVAHLTHLFNNAAWSPLVTASRREIVEIESIGPAARATIRAVPAGDGTPADYLLSLKQTNDGNWLITGLVRSELTAM